MDKNKQLINQLAQITSTVMTNSNKVAKFKAALKWLLQQLNEGSESIYLGYIKNACYFTFIYIDRGGVVIMHRVLSHQTGVRFSTVEQVQFDYPKLD